MANLSQIDPYQFDPYWSLIETLQITSLTNPLTSIKAEIDDLTGNYSYVNFDVLDVLIRTLERNFLDSDINNPEKAQLQELIKLLYWTSNYHRSDQLADEIQDQGIKGQVEQIYAEIDAIQDDDDYNNSLEIDTLVDNLLSSLDQSSLSEELKRKVKNFCFWADPMSAMQRYSELEYELGDSDIKQLIANCWNAIGSFESNASYQNSQDLTDQLDALEQAYPGSNLSEFYKGEVERFIQMARTMGDFQQYAEPSSSLEDLATQFEAVWFEVDAFSINRDYKNFFTLDSSINQLEGQIPKSGLDQETQEFLYDFVALTKKKKPKRSKTKANPIRPKTRPDSLKPDSK